MPYFGERSRFAVQFDMNENYGHEWMFGRFCYWCGGHRLGDYGQGTSLRDVLFQLERLVRDAGRRTSRRFAAISATEVFRLLDGALFGGTDLDNAEVAEEEQWARHNIVPAVDVFDRWKAFLVEGDSTARIVYGCAPYDRVSEFALKPGEVDSALEAARRSLDQIYEREVSAGTSK